MTASLLISAQTTCEQIQTHHCSCKRLTADQLSSAAAVISFFIFAACHQKRTSLHETLQRKGRLMSLITELLVPRFVSSRLSSVGDTCRLLDRGARRRQIRDMRCSYCVNSKAGNNARRFRSTSAFSALVTLAPRHFSLSMSSSGTIWNRRLVFFRSALSSFSGEDSADFFWKHVYTYN